MASPSERFSAVATGITFTRIWRPAKPGLRPGFALENKTERSEGLLPNQQKADSDQSRNAAAKKRSDY